MNLISVDAFRADARAKRKPDGGVFRVSVGKPKAVAGKDRTLRFCFSDASVDRMGDTIDPAGWDTHAFLRNPVALWAHDSTQPPIGRAGDVLVEDLRLMGDIEFASPDVYAFADTIFRMVGAGFINAVSVGFLPLDYDWSDDDDRELGIDFKRQELLEISVVPVPANANALAEARAKGIDTRPLVEWAQRTLDGGGKVIVPRAEIERLRKAAKEPRRPRRRAAEEWRCGADRDLPIDGSAEWDGAAAEASIFAQAGGDDFDPAEAKRGFLLYDAAAPKDRGSYKLPFARAVDGELKAVAEGIRAAASRLPDTDAPESERAIAREVIAHYEAKMNDGKSAPRRRRDAMSETDPAAGGVAVGNCGRKPDEDCGMKDPAECSIHGVAGAEAEGKRMDAKLRKLVQQELLRTLKSLRRDPADGDDPAGAEAPDKPVVEAYAHMKAAHVFHKMAMASQKKALDLLSDVVGDADGAGTGEGAPGDDDDDESKAIQEEIARLRLR